MRKFDGIVIGGGPAGMFAAITAAGESLMESSLAAARRGCLLPSPQRDLAAEWLW